MKRNEGTGQLCENCCGRPAQTYVRKAEGREVVLHLCPECYRALYPERGENAFAALAGAAGSESAACPVCGTTFGEYRRTGLLGCAGCYAAFREELSGAVRGIQGEVRHTGKRPEAQTEERYDRMRAYVTRRETLREQLEEAMRSHDYERANSLRRELRELTKRGEGTQ